jgi:large conductance mechanosensitive channel
MNKQLRGFLDFVREQGVVGIAVGIAIGIQASNFVSTLVSGLIDPLVGVILRGTDLTGIKTTITSGDSEQTFAWGIILQALISFLATAFVVYFLVKQVKLDKLDKKK